MSLAARRAAPVAVVLACAFLAGPAHAQDSDLPPLSGKPSVKLGKGTPTPTPTATPAATATATPEAQPREQLAATGSEPLLLALYGLGLLGTGLGLRRLAD